MEGLWKMSTVIGIRALMAVYIHFPQSFHGVDTCRKSIFISAIWAQLVGDPQGHVAVGRWVDDPPGHTSANGGRVRTRLS